MIYKYTEELDNILLKYGRVDDIANEGLDLVRDWKIGETIDTESDFNRLARLKNKEGDFVAVFPWCVSFVGLIENVSTDFILALAKLCKEVEACVDSQTEREKQGEGMNDGNE